MAMMSPRSRLNDRSTSYECNCPQKRRETLEEEVVGVRDLFPELQCLKQLLRHPPYPLTSISNVAWHSKDQVIRAQAISNQSIGKFGKVFIFFNFGAWA